jgi:hypothetical protein
MCLPEIVLENSFLEIICRKSLFVTSPNTNLSKVTLCHISKHLKHVQTLETRPNTFAKGIAFREMCQGVTFHQCFPEMISRNNCMSLIRSMRENFAAFDQ